MDLIFTFRIPLLLLVLVLLVFALPAGLIAGAALVAFLLWRRLVRKSRIEQERRDAAITAAVDGLPGTERFDWYNKEGRYAAVGSIPRTLPLRFMTEGERRRYNNNTGEFADGGGAATCVAKRPSGCDQTRASDAPIPAGPVCARAKSETPRGPFGCRGALSVRYRLQAVTDIGSQKLYRPMPDRIQQPLNGNEITAILTAISLDRFNTYLVAAGHSQERALRLYMWNAWLGEAFHTPIQAAEVALRNSVNLALSNVYTPNWWECKNLFDLLDEDRKGDLTTVLRRIRNKGLELYTGQVVAGLSFGFWVGILDGRYNPPIWGGQLRIAFPSFPAGRSRKSLHVSVRNVATLRNRISHHEPLIGRDSLADFSNLMVLLEWICPEKAAWIRPHCRVPQIVRERP